MGAVGQHPSGCIAIAKNTPPAFSPGSLADAWQDNSLPPRFSQLTALGRGAQHHSTSPRRVCTAAVGWSTARLRGMRGGGGSSVPAAGISSPGTSSRRSCPAPGAGVSAAADRRAQR